MHSSGFRGLGNPPGSSSQLASACTRGDACEVQLLLAADSTGTAANAADANGWTALMFAASNGHTDVLLLLLRSRADVDAVNSFRWTALYAACANGHLAAAQVLPFHSFKIWGNADAPVCRRCCTLELASTCPSAAGGHRSCSRRRAIACILCGSCCCVARSPTPATTTGQPRWQKRVA
jgi:hypothetical protein